MKAFTRLLMLMGAVAFASNVNAQCTDETVFKYFGHDNISWEPSDWFKIIDLDTEKLTDAALYPRTGAPDGKQDNANYGQGTVKAPVATGEIVVPLLDFVDGEFVPSDKSYSIKYWNCVFAPDHFTSAFTKVEDYGETPSGNVACAKNDNTVMVRSTYAKMGFIELSRQGSNEEEGSKHGGIQLDGLKGVEKIQWSYSATSWKRGVMCEVKWGDGDWQIQRSVPSGVGSSTAGYASFAEQGYEFEEIFDLVDEENWDKEFSIRFRIWDGDTITWKEAYDMGERPEGYFYTKVDPLGEPQAVRIHQIKVFAGMSGSDFFDRSQSSISSDKISDFKVYKHGNDIKLSEEGDVEIYTIDGKLVKTDTGKSINIAELSKGIYVVRAKTLTGDTQNIKIAL